MARKTNKICPVCGSEFKGTDGKITCSNACRTAAVRMRQKGKKLEFALIAKTKGQKLPSSKPIIIKTPERVENPPVLETSKELPPLLEVAQKEPENASLKLDLTRLEQKIAHNERINQLIKEQKEKKMPPGMLVRKWALMQQDAISELEKQIIQ